MRIDGSLSEKMEYLDELAVTVGAVVGFFAGVEAHVRLEVVVPREALAALFALERLLAGVRALVVLQDVLVAERAMADRAAEHLVPRTAVDAVGVAGRRRRRRDTSVAVSVAPVACSRSRHSVSLS